MQFAAEISGSRIELFVEADCRGQAPGRRVCGREGLDHLQFQNFTRGLEQFDRARRSPAGQLDLGLREINVGAIEPDIASDRAISGRAPGGLLHERHEALRIAELSPAAPAA